jgi:hypothetical protein
MAQAAQKAKPPSKRKVNKALGKARYKPGITPSAKKRKAKKSTFGKRTAHKIAKTSRHLEHAAAKGTGNVLRHLTASPEERAAHVKRKQQLH